MRGGVNGAGVGVMFSAGDPARGSAGYVASEAVDGALEGRRGTFALQQMGTVHAGHSRVEYVVVPGGGTGQLEGIGGTLALTVEADGTHRYVLDDTLGPSVPAM